MYESISTYRAVVRVSDGSIFEFPPFGFRDVVALDVEGEVEASVVLSGCMAAGAGSSVVAVATAAAAFGGAVANAGVDDGVATAVADAAVLFAKLAMAIVFARVECKFEELNYKHEVSMLMKQS